MKDIKWNGSSIKIEPPAKTKKLTGTRFASVLGADPWNTAFKTWCAVTKTYEEAFEGNKYTHAGEIIEPKVFDFLRKSMGFGNRLKTPTDIYGADYFNKTWGDFFRDTPIFGGMWDALIYGESDTPEYVVEVKTVQIDGRSGNLEERWKDGEAPHYQALQAALYAYLLGIDNVLIVCVTLEDKKGDYEHPEQVTPSFANGNVYIDEFKVSERYPNFDLYVEQATNWWNTFVAKGVSPEFDEKKDADILAALRTNSLNPESDISALVTEAEALKAEIDAVNATIADKEKRLKNVTEQIKQYALSQFREGDKKVEIKGSRLTFALSKTVSEKFNDKAFKEANPEEYNKYLGKIENYRLTTSEIKEDK